MVARWGGGMVARSLHADESGGGVEDPERRGGVGDGRCKEFLIQVREETRAPRRAARARWEADIDSVYDSLRAGTARARAGGMTPPPAGTGATGNGDPAGGVRNGPPDAVRAATLAVMDACCKYPNFVISSGGDIPPLSRWENIDAFFAAVREYYSR